MDELRMFLENEAWELCPVKASFKIVDLSVSFNLSLLLRILSKMIGQSYDW